MSEETYRHPEKPDINPREYRLGEATLSCTPSERSGHRAHSKAPGSFAPGMDHMVETAGRPEGFGTLAVTGP